MEFKLNKLRGMTTIEDNKKIDSDLSVELKNIVPKYGEDVIREGFVKVNDTKYPDKILSIFDYKTRYNLQMVIIGSSSNIYSMDGGYDVTIPATITEDDTFTLTAIKNDVWGVRDYGYNGTANITEDGAGSLNESSITFNQGSASTSTIKYSGSNDHNLTITLTDNTTPQLYGSDICYVEPSPWTLLYDLTTRTSATIRTRTPSTNADAVFNNKLYFITSGAEDIDFKSGNEHEYLDIISVDTDGNYTIEDTIEEADTALGMCIVALGSRILVGTGINGKIYYSTDGSDFSNSVSLSCSTIYCFEEFNSKYYCGTGYGGTVFESSDLSSWSSVYSIDVGIMRMIVFDSNLYIATSIGQDALGGNPHIVKYDGSNWTTVFTGTKTQFFGLEVFGSYLYAGEHDESAVDEGKIYRSSDGTNWTEVLDTGEDFPYVMAVVGSKLYVGCSDGKLYWTTDGTNWNYDYTPVNGDIFGLAYWNDTLFVTSTNKIYSHTV